METIKKLIKYGIIAFLILFLIIIINQIFAIYNNLIQINEVLAMAVALFMGILLNMIIVIPVYGIMKFPKPYKVPSSLEGSEYDEYIKLQIQRLKKNKALFIADYDFKGESDIEIIENSYAELKAISMERIKKDANSVFLTTAISQNGVLDGISVLFTLVTMVYKVVEIYENRPDFQRLLYLYGQIASVVLIAGSIEDLDLIEEQLEPVLTSILGSSLLSAIPGAVGVTTMITNSLVEGSVNALLTLRVGIVAQRYLSSTIEMDKATIRRGAYYEATKHLGGIIAKNGVGIVKSVTGAAKKATIDKIKSPFYREREDSY